MGSDWGVSTADVMDQIDAAVTRTNHDEPEAVILSVDHYAELITRADRDSDRVESELEAH